MASMMLWITLQTALKGKWQALKTIPTRKLWSGPRRNNYRGRLGFRDIKLLNHVGSEGYTVLKEACYLYLWKRREPKRLSHWLDTPSLLSRFNPCFPTPNPCTLHITLPIKYNEVSISTRTQSSFPIFDANTPKLCCHIQRIFSTSDRAELTWRG